MAATCWNTPARAFFGDVMLAARPAPRFTTNWNLPPTSMSANALELTSSRLRNRVRVPPVDVGLTQPATVTPPEKSKFG